MSETKDAHVYLALCHGRKYEPLKLPRGKCICIDRDSECHPDIVCSVADPKLMQHLEAFDVDAGSVDGIFFTGVPFNIFPNKCTLKAAQAHRFSENAAPQLVKLLKPGGCLYLDCWDYWISNMVLISEDLFTSLGLVNAGHVDNFWTYLENPKPATKFVKPQLDQ